MSRKLSILFVFVLLLQTLTSSFALPAQMNAAGSEESFIRNVTLLDEAGGVLNEANLNESTDVSVLVDWSVENTTVENGSSATIELTPVLSIQKEQTGKLVSKDEEVGTYTATVDGTVTVTFNEAAVEYPEANGSFTLNAKAEVEEQEEAAEEEPEADQPEKEEETEAVEDEEEQEGSDSEEDTETAESEVAAEEEEANEDAADTEEASKPENAEENKQPEETEKAAVQNEAKHGFNLELGKVKDMDGNPFTEENLLNPQAEFWLELEWFLENGHNYTAGDKVIFDLPNAIKIMEEMSGELKDETGLVVATYIISTDKKVELTFTDYVETHSNVKGWLEMILTLDEENVEVEDGEVIITPIGEEGEIRIPIDAGSKEKTIEKKGTPNKGHNADEIRWEVIINKNKTSLTNAKVLDLLPAGTEYKEGSLKAVKLIVDLYGNILGDGEEIDITGETVAEGVLTIPLGDIKDAYRIEYVTTITDDEETRFKNHAVLSDQELEDVSADATITIDRGEAIKKKAAKSYNPKTGIIEWGIEFNFNQKDLTDVILKDSWTPEGLLDLVEGSLLFKEVEVDEHGNAHETGNTGLPEGAVLVPGTDGFEVTGITTDKAYKITYQTKVKDRVLDPFEVVNTAGFGTESDGSGTKVGIYYGSKSAGRIDYAAKTIEWKIEVNHDEYPMEKISITDTLGSGLTLIEDSIEITLDGQAYTGDYTLTGDNPFTIEFPEEFKTDKKIEISYKTTFDANLVPDHRPTNKAAITWTPEGGDESITRDVLAGTELNWETRTGHWKNGSYNPETKEITWTIYTNYRESQFDNLVVKDAPQGNQKIVDDSVVVTELAIGENGHITEGERLDSSIVSIDKAANTLEVAIGETNRAYKIEYKTSLAGLSDIQKEYVNKAEVFDGTDVKSEIDARVGIAKTDTYGEKAGYQDGKQVHWSVNVNLGQQKITNLKLEDTISENQDYLTDTIKVYHASVDRNGNASKGEEVPSDQYELIHTPGEQTFTIAWKETVERAFIVEYSTLFFEKHNGEVTNTYKITGDNIIEDGKTDGGSTVTIRQTSSGGGSGEAGYLIIDKINTTDGGDEKLAGAVFDLIDPDTGKVLKSGTTDENGHIDFGRLLFGDYELHERVVPDGFVTPEERQIITIDKAYNTETDKIEYAYTVENYEPVFAIELEKVDDLGAVIPGVTFELYNSSDELIAAQTTDEAGKIRFENLQEAGTYYLVETEVPIGYEPGEERYVVEVGAKEKEPILIRVENQRELTSVNGKKVWEDEGNRDGIRPESITVNLLADGEVVQSAEVTAATGWTYSFTNLPKYKNGEQINYTITEDPVENYETVIDGFDITNSHKPELVDIPVIKTWDDGDDQDGIRPKSIIVNLLADGEQVKTAEVSAEDNWQYSFKNLYKYKDGKEIEYTITEEPVEGYETIISDFTITNKYDPEVTEFSGIKTWDDANNQDGVRPESITVNLLADGAFVDSVEVTEEDNWEYSFVNLPKNAAGKEIVYTVTENTAENYTTEIDGSDLTNHYAPGKTSVTVTKHWDDANNQDGIRPDSIEVQLTADGEAQGDPVELSEENDWTYTWTMLDEKAAGEVINYSVIETTEVPGYKIAVNDENHGNIIITNAYTPETIDIAGDKIWKDANNKSGHRPDKITVNLYADGELADSVEVTEEDNWKYSFTGLPKYNAGEEIAYTVGEDAVKGYKATIDGYNITNTLVAEETVTGSKDPETDKDEGTKAVAGKADKTSTDSKAAGKKLPRTATDMFNLLAIGIGLLGLGAAIVLYRRKRESN
ncbi:Cna B-type domain-containing protein [Oceanobacillus sp. FSL H7-0719]|uniref:Cna B-type domain-containing protein n=1 Tax=Oceanobacillus sp. FSL H7-0719 TaxID=2954507 RepID=UPI003255E1E4